MSELRAMDIDALANEWRRANEAWIASGKSRRDLNEQRDMVSSMIWTSDIGTGESLENYLERQKNRANKMNRDIDINSIFSRILSTPHGSFSKLLKSTVSYALKANMRQRMFRFKQKIHDPEEVPSHIYNMPESTPDEMAEKIRKAFEWEELGLGQEYDRVKADAAESMSPISDEQAIEMAKRRPMKAAMWWDRTYPQVRQELLGAIEQLKTNPATSPDALSQVVNALTPEFAGRRHSDPKDRERFREELSVLLPDIRVTDIREDSPLSPIPENPHTWSAGSPKRMFARYSAMRQILSNVIAMAKDETSPLHETAKKLVQDYNLESGFGRGENFLSGMALSPAQYSPTPELLAEVARSGGRTRSYDVLQKGLGGKDDEEDEQGWGSVQDDQDEDVKRRIEPAPTGDVAERYERGMEEETPSSRRTKTDLRDPMDVMRNDMSKQHIGYLDFLAPREQAQPVGEKTSRMLDGIEKAIRNRGSEGQKLIDDVKNAYEANLMALKRKEIRDLPPDQAEAAKARLKERASRDVDAYFKAKAAPAPGSPGKAPAGPKQMTEKQLGRLQHLTPEQSALFNKTRHRFDSVRPFFGVGKRGAQQREASRAMLQWMAENMFQGAERAVASEMRNLNLLTPSNYPRDKQQRMYETTGEQYFTKEDRSADNMARLNRVMTEHGVGPSLSERAAIIDGVISKIYEGLANDSTWNQMRHDINDPQWRQQRGIGEVHVPDITAMRAALRLMKVAVMGMFMRRYG